MRKIILIFFLFNLILSKKNFLGPEILSEELYDDIALQKSGSKGFPRLISIPKPVTPRPLIPSSNPARVNSTPLRVKPIPIRVNSNPVKTRPIPIKTKTTLFRVSSIPAIFKPSISKRQCIIPIKIFPPNIRMKAAHVKKGPIPIKVNPIPKVN